MNRASEIEKAAMALAEGCRFSMDERFVHAPAKALVDAVDDALALPPDPPGECCRRAAEAMREAAARCVVGDCDLGEECFCAERAQAIRALPLPGAKEGA